MRGRRMLCARLLTIAALTVPVVQPTCTLERRHACLAGQILDPPVPDLAAIASYVGDRPDLVQQLCPSAGVPRPAGVLHAPPIAHSRCSPAAARWVAALRISGPPRGPPPTHASFT